MMKQFILYPYFTAMLLLAIIGGTPSHSFAKYQYGSIIMSKYEKDIRRGSGLTVSDKEGTTGKK